MGDFFKHLGVKVVSTVLGVIVCLAWWTLTGHGGSDFDQFSEIPGVVFEGGGGALAIEATVNQPAELRATFSRRIDEETGEEEGIHVHQPLAAGTHHFETNVPAGVYIYLEIGVPEAQPGARIEWSVKVDGKGVVNESESLEEPLRSGYAFFVQLEFDDIGGIEE